jgi:uncharacterized membrane protein (DUF485 family)
LTKGHRRPWAATKAEESLSKDSLALIMTSSSILVMLATAAPTIILSADAWAAAPARGLLVDHQSVKFAVWLGIAVLALICASLYLWRTRRVLNQVQQDCAATQIKPAPVPEFTSSAIAS